MRSWEGGRYSAAAGTGDVQGLHKDDSHWERKLCLLAA